MSAIGPKQTWAVASHMSAFRGKADMTVCGCLLSRSLLGAKRTSLFAAHMSASDPKRTLGGALSRYWFEPLRCPVLSLEGHDEAARIHYAGWRRGGVAPHCAWAAGDAGGRVPQQRITGGICSLCRCVPARPQGNRLRGGSEHHNRIPVGRRPI